MKHYRKRTLLTLLCAVLCLWLLACAGPEVQPEERIANTFSSLGVTDAVFVEQVSDPGRSKDGCLLYTSDATQMGYYFDPDSGTLKSIHHYSRMDPSYSEGVSSDSALAPMQVSSSNLESELIAYAKACIGDDRIGTLQLKRVQDMGMLHRYTVVEIYDGYETGTTVTFSCDSSGRINTCSVAIGSVFTGGPSGTYVFTAGGEPISEEAAIEAARNALAALMDPAWISGQASCELSAAQDALIYTVTMDYTDKDGQTRNYLATINAHTGEVRQECTT